MFRIVCYHETKTFEKKVEKPTERVPNSFLQIIPNLTLCRLQIQSSSISKVPSILNYFQHFHKLHHTYKQPTAFSVTAIHPVEFLNIQAIYVAPMFTVPMFARECHCHHFINDPVYLCSAFYCAMLLYIYYHGIIDHSGITFKALWWQPWQPDCIFHDNHHQYFHVR